MKLRLFLALLSAAAFAIILSQAFILPSSQDFLIEGKNYIQFNSSEEKIDAMTMIKLNPEIVAISYKDGNESVGYLNILGGIGKNFILEEREYEIISSKNVSLNFGN